MEILVLASLVLEILESLKAHEVSRDDDFDAACKDSLPVPVPVPVSLGELLSQSNFAVS